MRNKKEKTLIINLNLFDTTIVLKDKYFDLKTIKEMLDDKSDFIKLNDYIISKNDINSIKLIEDNEEEETL